MEARHLSILTIRALFEMTKAAEETMVRLSRNAIGDVKDHERPDGIAQGTRKSRFNYALEAYEEANALVERRLEFLVSSVTLEMSRSKQHPESAGVVVAADFGDGLVTLFSTGIHLTEDNEEKQAKRLFDVTLSMIGERTGVALNPVDASRLRMRIAEQTAAFFASVSKQDAPEVKA